MSNSITIAATENHGDIEVAGTWPDTGFCTITGRIECGDEYLEFDGAGAADIAWEVA